MSSEQQAPDKPLTPPQAWQPFTPRGVAAFAGATPGRLLLVQFVVALLVGATIVWFISTQWFPVIIGAIRQLPDAGMIQGGALNTPLRPVRLAGNRLLAVVIDAQGSGHAGRVADVEITLKRSHLAVCGVLGCWDLAYPRGYIISVNRPELEPWWGARRSLFAAGIGIAVIAHLFLVWWGLGLVACPFVKLITFYGDRDISWKASLRLAQAALMPGAAIIVLALVLYAFGMIDPIRLLLFYALHIVCGIVFLFTAPFFLERTAGSVRRKNPFGSADSNQAAPPDNPFAGRRD